MKFITPFMVFMVIFLIDFSIIYMLFFFVPYIENIFIKTVTFIILMGLTAYITGFLFYFMNKIDVIRKGVIESGKKN